MPSNLYIVLGLFGGVPEPVAITQSETEYEDYIKTRDSSGLKTIVINRDHPKCPDIENLYDNDNVIIDYFEDCPVTKCEEEVTIDLESEIHTHMLSYLSKLGDEINKGYIRFEMDELRDIAEMIAIFRRRISVCCDEEACVDINEELNLKELLKHSRMLKVPFKE